MTTIILSIIAFHFILGIVVFMSTDISPLDAITIKIWKALIIGGPIMLIPRIIARVHEAEFNWNLREWIIK